MISNIYNKELGTRRIKGGGSERKERVSMGGERGRVKGVGRERGKGKGKTESGVWGGKGGNGEGEGGRVG